MRSILEMLDTLKGNESYSTELVESFYSKVKTVHFKKGELIQQKASSSFVAYFVKSGLLRSFVLDEKGKEHIFMFAPEGWIMSDLSDLSSSQLERPLTLTMEALEDSEVEVFDPRNLSEVIRQMVETDSAFAQEEIKRLLKRISVLQKRILMLMSYPAYDRYTEFVETYPNLLQRVPQKMIASYLGITPEALSKIKKENIRK